MVLSLRLAALASGLDDDGADTPALAGAQRTGGDDLDDVAHRALVPLVVGHELAAAADELVVPRMPDAAIDLDDDRLLAGDARHGADLGLPARAVRGGDGRAHGLPPPAAPRWRSPRTVRCRAIERRTSRILVG